MYVLTYRYLYQNIKGYSLPVALRRSVRINRRRDATQPTVSKAGAIRFSLIAKGRSGAARPRPLTRKNLRIVEVGMIKGLRVFVLEITTYTCA